MKLSEFVKEHEKEFLYIGSGANFFAIGYGRDILPYLQVQNDRYYQYFEASLKTLEAEVKSLPRRINLCRIRIFEAEASIENAKENIKDAEEALERIKGNGRKLTLGQKMCCKSLTAEIKKNKEAIEEYKQTIEIEKRKLSCRQMDMKSLPKRLTSNRLRLAQWVSLADREVADTYPRQFEEPYGTIVIVQGTETGEFWCYDEFLNAVNTGKLKSKLIVNKVPSER